MSTAGPAPELGATRTLRPNPFAFASDTSFRFALLIAGVAGATPFIWSQLWLLGNMDQARVAMTTCARRHQPTSTDDPAEFFRNYIDAGSAVWSCMRPAWGRPAALIGLVGVAVLFAVAAILYWCMPSWRIRRLRLEPLPADAIPGMVDELERLQDEAGVRGQVRFLIDAVNRSAGALAFGRVGRRYIVLHAGLIKQFDDDRPAFGAIVRHELAHVRNGDLDKTYLAVAIWWAFVAVALVPSVGNELLQAARGQGATLVRISWRVVAVTLLVLLARNGVLRARELYADARASTWEGSVGGLRRILADGASLPQRQVPRWRIPFRFHPSPRQRLATLDDTRPLLAIGFWEALAAGLVAALAIETVQGSLDGLTDLTLAAAHANLWRTGLLYGPLVAGVVGLGVWRAAFADHLAGGSHSVLRPNRLGVGLGVGLALGSRYLNLKAGVINETDDAVGREVPAVTLLIGAAVIIAGSWLVVR